MASGPQWRRLRLAGAGGDGQGRRVRGRPRSLGLGGERGCQSWEARDGERGAPREDPSSAGFSAPDRARAVSPWPWGGHSSGTRRELPRSWGAVTERDATATTCSCGRGRELRAGPRSGTCPRSAALYPRAPLGPKVRAAGPSPPRAPPPRPGLCPAHSGLPLSSPAQPARPSGPWHLPCPLPAPRVALGAPWAPGAGAR